MRHILTLDRSAEGLGSFVSPASSYGPPKAGGSPKKSGRKFGQGLMGYLNAVMQSDYRPSETLMEYLDNLGKDPDLWEVLPHRACVSVSE